MIEYTKIKRMEKNKMKSINLKTVGNVTHNTFNKRKINDNTLLKTAGFFWLCIKNKTEILQQHNISVFLHLKTKKEGENNGKKF